MYVTGHVENFILVLVVDPIYLLKKVLTNTYFYYLHEKLKIRN